MIIEIRQQNTFNDPDKKLCTFTINNYLGVQKKRAHLELFNN